MLDHIDFAVTGLARSRAFHLAALALVPVIAASGVALTPGKRAPCLTGHEPG